MVVDVAGVEVIGEYRLRLSFADGTVGDIDFAGRTWSGVFEPLRDPDYFAHVAVDPEAGTIVWPDGLDMAPEPLYAEARANVAHASTCCEGPCRLRTFPPHRLRAFLDAPLPRRGV